MQLTLIKTNYITNYTLPEKVNGQFWITNRTENNTEERIVSVEAIGGHWVLKTGRNALIKNTNGSTVREMRVEPLNFYNIFIVSSGENAFLFSEPVTDDRRQYKKYMLPYSGRITIGRSASCDICYKNTFVSSKHAELTINGGEVYINDLGSTNGTFVNGRRVSHHRLLPSQTIYIMGLKIIVGKGFISINNPDNLVKCGDTLGKYIRQHISDAPDETLPDEEHSSNAFYRSPRFMRKIETATINIDPPPQSPITESLPTFLTVAPAVTMGMASVAMAAVSIVRLANGDQDILSAIPMLCMAVAMLMGTILWPTVTKNYEKKKKEQKEQERQKKYTAYINSIRERIRSEIKYQSEILNENSISAEYCAARIRQKQRNLWERSVGQDDFLTLRLGLGDRPLDCEIKYQQRRFSLEVDNLQEIQYRVAEEPKVLHNVPITMSLRDMPVSGVIGDRSKVTAFAKSLLVQLAALHSYDEMKLVIICDQDEYDTWKFARWFPHIWNDDKTVRYFASTPGEVKEISLHLEQEFKARQKLNNYQSLELVPHYVILAFSKQLADRSEIVKQVSTCGGNCGFSLVAFYDELRHLPKDCSGVIDLSHSTAHFYDKNDTSGDYTPFAPEYYVSGGEDELAVTLANIELDSMAENFDLPGMFTFLEMFGVGRIEHLNCLTRWHDNDPTVSLETAVGIDTMGELFKLDLHEKYHGPHGLIAGMTGSGKSEFIITFILSLAINYHPHEVSFILIDYKGGGMAKAFERLPHTAGIITNLDGAEVNRSLVSIEAELKRRQDIFSRTSKMVGTSNIDIYKYQKLYRDGTVTEPLPHLFIISDEFAELKTQQPEFMKKLISAARIGRSLGVHLILATQKPSGVVDDQIWSNAKFRVCLKVQDRQDSMDMLKRPEAAELTHTGRFYLQVGYNELFELGQSAWAGASYVPSDRVEKQRDNSIQIIDNTGRTIKALRPAKQKKFVVDDRKQLDAITEYLAELAKGEDISVRQLWCPPIPAMIYLRNLLKKYDLPRFAGSKLAPVIGEYDDPVSQKQNIMTLPLTDEGNAIIYGATGNGKTTLITTMLFSLISRHTPDECNIYIMDFSSQTLPAFAKAPHVGGVALIDEREKVENLFTMVEGEMIRRRSLFQEYGGDIQSYLHGSGDTIPSIVVVIHNYSALVETYEGLEEKLTTITRDCTKYGIYFVMTATSSNAIRYRLLQNFNQLLVLRMNDDMDYSAILGNIGGMRPSKHKGRGIFKRGEVYEFQTAHIVDEKETLSFVRAACDKLRAGWDGSSARPIPVLPDRVDIDFLTPHIDSAPDGFIPLGVDKAKRSIVNYPLLKQSVTWLTGESAPLAPHCQGIAEIAAAVDNLAVTVIDAANKFEPDGAIGYNYINSASGLEECAVDIFNEMVRRNNTYKTAQREGTSLPEFKRTLCIINSIDEFCKALSSDGKEKLLLAIENCQPEYNFFFLICDDASVYKMKKTESWYKKQTSMRDIIWVGGNLSSLFNLQLDKAPRSANQYQPAQFGFIVQNGKAQLCKLAVSQCATIGEEDDDYE